MATNNAMPSAQQKEDAHNSALNAATKEDAPRAAALRIIFGVVLLADVAHIYANWSLFRATALWPSFPVGPACLIWIAALVLLIFGFRIGAYMNWACCSVMLGIVAPNEGFQQAAGDSITIGIAFLLVILPRLDARSVRWLVALYLTSIYLDSGIHKALSPMWASGSGVAGPMGLPCIVWAPTSWMIWLPAWIWRVMGWGVVAFEISFGALYLWRITRIPALLTGIALHAGIAVIYPIPVFGWLMICLYAALLPAEWYRPGERILRRTPQGKPLALNPRAIAAVAVLWALAIASVYGPRGYLPNRLYNKAGWLIAGIASHEVFSDEQFDRYTYQLRLVWPDGARTPYSRGNLFAWNVRDRVWELWWKRTQAPWGRLQDADAHLLAWARTNGNGAAPVMIEGRPQTSLTRVINPDLFQRNNSIPWRSIGTIRASAVEWQVAPRDGQEKVGDYMESLFR